MADCFYCEQNGFTFDGGDVRLCHHCSKKTCRTCGKPSAGKHLCTDCEYGEDLDRMRGRAKQPWFFPDETRFDLRVREELMWEAKRLVHQAVEMAFRGFILALDAMWGGFGKKERISVPDPHPEFPEFKKVV